MKDLLFIETMRVVNGEIANLQGHINRMSNTIAEAFGLKSDLSQLFELAIPTDAGKCRIVYGEQIKSIEFSDYIPRMVNSLKLVDVGSDFDYHLKFADRSALNSLRELRGDCDEILIVKNGYITDTSYSNVVFTDGQHFVTPSTFLLPGTMRASLLNSGLITEATITPSNIKQFTHVTLINAMLPLHSLPLIPIDKIM